MCFRLILSICVNGSFNLHLIPVLNLVNLVLLFKLTYIIIFIIVIMPIVIGTLHQYCVYILMRLHSVVHGLSYS